MDHRFEKYLTRYPAVPTTVYVALVVVLGIVAWMATSDLIDQRQAVTQAEELLAQLDRGQQSAAPHSEAGAPQGSPFLEGPTVTVAGAGLLQRVAGAVTKVGGNIGTQELSELPAMNRNFF